MTVSYNRRKKNRKIFKRVNSKHLDRVVGEISPIRHKQLEEMLDEACTDYDETLKRLAD